MDQHAIPVAAEPRLAKAGVLRLATVVLGLVLAAAIFFASAGTLDVPRVWWLYGASIVYMLVAIVLMLAFFPGVVELVNERGRTHEGAKRWDKVFGISYTVLLFATPALAGIDVGRLHWSEVPLALAWPAIAVTIVAYVLGHWSMIANRHAETMVRIQEDRDHHVASSGPYRFVRHPMYVSILLTQLAYPVAVGSLWAYVPVLAIVALFVWRTAMEDATLKAELAGYAEYSETTRYWLLPGVW